MKFVAATQLKAQCFALLDSLGLDGIVITRRGKPVAKLVAIESASADLIGRFRGRMRVNGDIVRSSLTK